MHHSIIKQGDEGLPRSVRLSLSSCYPANLMSDRREVGATPQ